MEQPGQGAALVMALVEGVSLREVIARGGPLGAEAALVVLKDALLALDAASALGVPHRDLKPENVLIDANGWCMLTDFGVAVKTSKRMAAGTPAYMAPELWNGASSGPATDIYAATAVLWECVTGSPPFSGPLRQLRRQHKSASVPIERFEQPVQGLIAWGMAKSPADRPESARAFVDDLEARAVAAYGDSWVEHGRRELEERAAALVPLLEGNGASSATATRVARRKRLNFVLVGTSAVVTLVALAALALSAMSGKAQPSSLTVAVMSAQVIVTPPVAASTCATSTTFTYTGTVTDTGPGKLSYRWLYSSGKPGPVQTLSFTVPGHRQVSGGTVTVGHAGSGWAEIKVAQRHRQDLQQGHLPAAVHLGQERPRAVGVGAAEGADGVLMRGGGAEPDRHRLDQGQEGGVGQLLLGAGRRAGFGQAHGDLQGRRHEDAAAADDHTARAARVGRGGAGGDQAGCGRFQAGHVHGVVRGRGDDHHAGGVDVDVAGVRRESGEIVTEPGQDDGEADAPCR